MQGTNSLQLTFLAFFPERGYVRKEWNFWVRLKGLPMIGLLFLLLGHGDQNPFADTKKQAAQAATVKVVNLTERKAGTGVIIGRRGDFLYVLTARHVVADANSLEILPFSEANPSQPLKPLKDVRVVASSDEIRDLALLRIAVTEETFPVILLCPARTQPKEAGFKALSLGCSLGHSPTCEMEEVIAKKKATRGLNGKTGVFWEVGSEIQEGRSGGPLLDHRGMLIGICSGVSKEKGYFTHADEIRGFLEAKGFGWLR
jgi:S1-C subfamily serine protease